MLTDYGEDVGGFGHDIGKRHSNGGLDAIYLCNFVQSFGNPDLVLRLLSRRSHDRADTLVVFCLLCELRIGLKPSYEQVSRLVIDREQQKPISSCGRKGSRRGSRSKKNY